MTTISTILDSSYRVDLVAAHAGIIDGLAHAGTWWTATERIAIAAEVRRARQNEALPPWRSPSAEGLVVADQPLPPGAVDAIWRITNHPGTLTREWYTEVVDELPSPLHYVELVAVVAAVNSIDRFAGIMNIAPIRLPDAQPGDPSRVEVKGVGVTSHWVPTTPGPGANVLRALSVAVADEAPRAALAEAQYLPADALLGDLNWGRDTIDRRQIELLAAATSMINECFY